MAYTTANYINFPKYKSNFIQFISLHLPAMTADTYLVPVFLASAGYQKTFLPYRPQFYQLSS